MEITYATIVQWTREHKTMEKKKNKRMIKEPSIDKISLGNFSMELAKENLPWEDPVKLCIFHRRCIVYLSMVQDNDKTIKKNYQHFGSSSTQCWLITFLIYRSLGTPKWSQIEKKTRYISNIPTCLIYLGKSENKLKDSASFPSTIYTWS